MAVSMSMVSTVIMTGIAIVIRLVIHVAPMTISKWNITYNHRYRFRFVQFVKYRGGSV